MLTTIDEILEGNGLLVIQSLGKQRLLGQTVLERDDTGICDKLCGCGFSYHHFDP